MPSIRFVSSDGSTVETVDAGAGDSVMETAVANGIDGIVAECGGNAMCATCHVYVAPEWLDRLPPMLDFEDAMLELTVSPRRENSRLSCQIIIDGSLDGLTIRVPESQV